MSESHDKLPKIFWVQLALAAIIGIIFLTTPSKHSEDQSGAEDSKVAAVAKNLEPIGAVSTKDSNTSDSAKVRSGEEVYKASCMACHASGVANAPKPDDKAAWKPRVASGLDALMKTAIVGKGAMPARGGNPTVTDDEIKSAILYMTGKAGFDLSSAKKIESSNTVSKTAMTETKKVVAVVAKEVEKVMPTTAAIVPTAPSAPAAPVAPKTMEEAPAKPTAPDVASEPKTETFATTAPVANNKKGEEVYKSACFACHEAGVAGSPKLGDKAAWTARIATGSDALYVSAINGKGIMPPKGGNMSLSDDNVKAAVDYMTVQSQ